MLQTLNLGLHIQLKTQDLFKPEIVSVLWLSILSLHYMFYMCIYNIQKWNLNKQCRVLSSFFYTTCIFTHILCCTTCTYIGNAAFMPLYELHEMLKTFWLQKYSGSRLHACTCTYFYLHTCCKQARDEVKLKKRDKKNLFIM